MRKMIATAAGLIALWTAVPSSAPVSASSGSAYDFEFQSIDGQPLKLAAWRGKALLVVNTASFCGFTKQYAGLQDIWSKYEAAGLVVVGVPSNDFGEQEPKSEGDIKAFCEGAFGVTFPLTAKQTVIGPNAHPFYQWASAQAGPDGRPNWNFHKYLIGRDGRLVRSFSTQLSPNSVEVTDWIEKVLAETQSSSNAVQN